MNRNIPLALCAAIAMGLTFEAAARPPAFADIDSDQDGRVSLAEFQEMHARRMTVEERFARLDANSDGYLSETEIAARMRKHGPRERKE